VTEPTEADKAQARELCALLAQEYDLDEHPRACGWCAACAVALAKASEKGRREERRACWVIAEQCRNERLGELPACIATGGAVDALRGKLSEATRIGNAIAARGSMAEADRG